MAQYNVNSVVVPLPASGEDDFIVWKNASKGGAVTVIDAYAVNHATTSSTVSYSVALHRRSASGTVIAGTIAPATGGTAASGTSSHWTDLVPKSLSVAADQSVIDQGECISIDYQSVNAGTATRGHVMIHYVQGKS